MHRYLIYNSDADEAVPPQLIYTSPTSFLRRWETLFNQFSIKNKNVPKFGTPDCRQSAPRNESFSESFFLVSINFVLKRGTFPLDYVIRNPHSLLHFASFFKFMHANVSATFIVIRALPYNCVYRNP